jgi:glucose-fructose oxidoreductase
MRPFLLTAATLLASAFSASAQAPARVAIVGLTHGHVQGFLHNLPKHHEVQLVGISEPDATLRAKYEKLYHFDSKLLFADEKAMLAATHPQAILVYTAPAGHLAAIQVAAPMGIAAMVEKPLATTVPDALAIQHLADQYKIPVLTNYETTWYASNAAASQMLADGKLGELRRVVFHDGHEGPKEIGVDPEFLGFLTDAKQNGAGALFDFGCYGADLATVLNHGQLPLSVTAVTHTDKPAVYPHIDDDSTILVQYPKAVADIEGSWNWPFSRKDMEIYGSTGYVDTVYISTGVTDHLRLRLHGEKEEHTETAPALAAPQDDSLNYLVAVLNGSLHPHGDLTALDTNVTVVRILAAARESAATGRTITLSAK